MKRANLTHSDAVHAGREFALSSHQMMSVSHPRASIRAVVALNAEQRAIINE